MIVRHQRSSASGNGFRQLARYVRGQSHAARATWFLAANLPAVTKARDVELACRLVEAVQAQNTRAGKARTYHLVISLHPEDRSLDRRELRRVVEHLVDVLGFTEHQYVAALPVSTLDEKRLTKQLALRQCIDVRNLRRRLAAQRKAIQKTPHPGTWRHFVASRAADRDTRAIQLLQRRGRHRGSHDLERGC